MEHETLRDWYYIKFAMMILFICGDLFVNSKAEYEALEVEISATDGQQGLVHSSYTSGNYERMSQLQIILFGCAVLIQASIFSAFFLILVDTFPFQVGLLGVVGKQFKHMLIAQAGYGVVSAIVGAMRLNQVFNGSTHIWNSGFYITMSFLQKLVAPCYYAVSLRSALRLGDEMYYAKDAWISPPTTLSSGDA